MKNYFSRRRCTFYTVWKVQRCRNPAKSRIGHGSFHYAHFYPRIMLMANSTVELFGTPVKHFGSSETLLRSFTRPQRVFSMFTSYWKCQNLKPMFVAGSNVRRSNWRKSFNTFQWLQVLRFLLEILAIIFNVVHPSFH